MPVSLRALCPPQAPCPHQTKNEETRKRQEKNGRPPHFCLNKKIKMDREGGLLRGHIAKAAIKKMMRLSAEKSCHAVAVGPTVGISIVSIIIIIIITIITIIIAPFPTVVPCHSSRTDSPRKSVRACMRTYMRACVALRACVPCVALRCVACVRCVRACVRAWRCVVACVRACVALRACVACVACVRACARAMHESIDLCVEACVHVDGRAGGRARDYSRVHILVSECTRRRFFCKKTADT